MLRRSALTEALLRLGLSLTLILGLVFLCGGCGGGSKASDWRGPKSGRPPATAVGGPSAAPAAPADPYPVSPRGGTPATGPGKRFNNCERVWCTTHLENFALGHFERGHVGWLIHDETLGDLFVPQKRTEGPGYPNARATALYLCGVHMHPFILGKYGGPIRHTGFNLTLGYNRTHFNLYGTRLDPCCENGLGSGFIHSTAGRQFRLHDLDEYRAHPELGWQTPFTAHGPIAQAR